MAQYSPLAELQQRRSGPSVELSFSTIAEAAGGLPDSARRHRAWWSERLVARAGPRLAGCGWQVDDFRPDQALSAFVDLTDSLVADYDALDFLYRLLDHSIPLTQAAAGAVLLHYEGSFHLVASSDEDAQAVELFEVQNAQRPAGDAFPPRGKCSNSPHRRSCRPLG